MIKIDAIFIAISLLMGGLCFYSTKIIVFGGIVIVIFIIDYFLLIRKKIKKYFFMIDRVNSCFHFINSFVITLSVTGSLEESYLNATRIGNKEYKETLKGIEDHPVVDRVKYLKDYYHLAIYKMFLNVFDLFQDQGGNILSMSDNLLSECTRVEKTLNETKMIGIKHLVEFIMLWAMSLAILVFMRFSIKDFYNQMLTNKIIGPMIFFFFILCLVSINLFVGGFVNLNIKEDYENEKD